MPKRIQNIVDHINRLQEELETILGERADRFSYSIENRRIKFQADTLRWQKQFKPKVWRYILASPILNILSAPVIYSLIIPFVLLDIWVSLYQAICFPIYKMKKVKRRDYIVFDRHHLAYLNLVEKLNCAYCSYGNGLLAYTLEIAARTEAFWCPIKHASKMRVYHRLHADFSEYGDAENYRADRKRNIEAMRAGEENTSE